MSGKGTVQRAVSDSVRCIQKISKVQVGWTKPMQNWPMQSRLGWRAACIIWWQAVLSHQIGGSLFSDSCECVSQWQWSNEGFVERSQSAVQFLVPCARLRTSKKDQKKSFFDPPCIAHYKVDILCAYKVGFRSPLYIPTMGDKAVFCARNMPLDLEDDFIRTLAFQFIPGWFPTRKRLNICGNAFYRPLVPFHNMSHHPLYRNMSPQLFRANIFLLGLYTWQSTL